VAILIYFNLVDHVSDQRELTSRQILIKIIPSHLAFCKLEFEEKDD